MGLERHHLDAAGADGYSAGGYLDDLWSWNGTDGTQVTPDTSPSFPPAVTGASMIDDPDTGQLLLFGGINSSGTWNNDTWVYNGP